MIAVFKIKSYSSSEIDAVVSVMTKNGYKVIFEKGDRVSLKLTIVKDGMEFVSMEGNRWEE